MSEQQPIDPRPKWLINLQAEKTQPGVLEVDGKQYIFTIIRAGIEPRLPYAVGFPMENALMISADVPKKERPFILGHEVREVTRFADLPEEKRCLASLKAELEEVKQKAPEIYQNYIAKRSKMFDALVEYYKDPAQAATKTPEFRQGLEASRVHLHELTNSKE